LEISRDDLNDWATRAADLDELMKRMDDALLEDDPHEVGYIVDVARPQAHLLLNMLLRAGAELPDPDRQRRRYVDSAMYDCYDESEEAVRAAQALERAALLVLTLENEYGVVGNIGEALADLAAEFNLQVYGRQETEI
jgi:hypothetical protein